MRIKQLVGALSCAAILVGCGSGADSSAPSQNIDLQAATKAHAISQSVINDNLVFADSLGVLPLSEASGHNYLFRINNSSTEKYSLVSLSLGGKSGETEVENEVLSASAAACSSLDVSSSCSIQLTPKATKSANTLLVIKLKDSSGKIREIQQMVRMSDSIFSADGIAFANDLEQVVTADGNYSIALPVILSADFDDIQVANGSLQCDGGYYKGNSCTYLISGKSLGDNSIVSAEIIGYRAGVQVAKVSEDILVKTTEQASLLLSQGASTSDLDAATELVVYNNGNATAHGLKFLPDAQLKLVSGAECLSHDLPAHSACSLQVANSSESNGYAGLSLRAADADTASTQIRNINSREKIDLSFSTTGNLHNVLIEGESATQTITIKNISDRKLTAFSVNIAASPSSRGLTIADNSCVNLDKSERCSVVLSYKPTGIINNKINLLVRATYIDDNGDKETYKAEDYEVRYSSLSGVGVLSISEVNPSQLTILSNGLDKKSKEFTLKLTKTGIKVQLTSLKLESNVDGLTLRRDNKCDINESSSCLSTVTYGPVRKPATNQTNRVKVSYKISMNNKHSYTATSNLFYLHAKPYAAIIEFGGVTVGNDKPLAFQGTGDENNPYKFIALKGQYPLVLNYTLTNTGNATAKDFKVTGIDNKLVTSTGTCSIAHDLKPNTSCTLGLILPANDLFNMKPYEHTSIVDLALAVSYVYNDQSSNLGVQHAGPTKYIQFTRNWANISYNDMKIEDLGREWKFSITARHSSVNANLVNDVYPIKIEATAPSFLNNAHTTSCEISAANSSCEATIFFDKTNLEDKLTDVFRVNMEAKPQSLDSDNTVYGLVNFTFAQLVQHETILTSSTDKDYEFEIRSKLITSGASNSSEVTVTPTLKAQVTGAVLGSCTIAIGADSCINKISIPKRMFMASNQLIVGFTSEVNGVKAVSTHSVGLTIKGIRTEEELIEAFKGDTSGKLFILENDIVLTKQWIPVTGLKNATFDGQGHKITNLQASCLEYNCGFFKVITDNVTVKNLNLQGVVDSNGHRNVGLLAGYIYNSNFKLLNSNFKTTISGNYRIGGVIGYSNSGIAIESVTVISKVNSTGERIGGLIGEIGPLGYSSVRNIRVNTELSGTYRVGGVVGVVGVVGVESTVIENVIADATLRPTVTGGNNHEFGGLLGGGRRVNMNFSNIDISMKLIGKAKIISGIGNISKNTIVSNVITRGVIPTPYDPRTVYNFISGISFSGVGEIVSVKNAVDMTTISYNGANYVSPLLARDPNNYQNSSNVYYVLPPSAGSDAYIAAVNPGFVEQLTARGALAQKIFLEGKGFDFTNTWTIKKDSANNDIIGIKEDLIPQFPTNW